MSTSKIKTIRPATVGIALMAGMFSLLMAAQSVTAAGVVESPIFKNKKLGTAVSRIVGKASIQKSTKVTILSAPIAEDGVEVGIGVRATGLKNVQSITIFAADNSQPLLARFKIPAGTTAFVKSRVKLRQSTRIIALIKADGKYYTASKEVKITKGGCGG